MKAGLPNAIIEMGSIVFGISRAGIYKVFAEMVPAGAESGIVCSCDHLHGSGGSIDMNSLFFGADGTISSSIHSDKDQHGSGITMLFFNSDE